MHMIADCTYIPGRSISLAVAVPSQALYHCKKYTSSHLPTSGLIATQKLSCPCQPRLILAYTCTTKEHVNTTRSFTNLKTRFPI